MGQPPLFPVTLLTIMMSKKDKARIPLTISNKFLDGNDGWKYASCCATNVDGATKCMECRKDKLVATTVTVGSGTIDRVVGKEDGAKKFLYYYSSNEGSVENPTSTSVATATSILPIETVPCVSIVSKYVPTMVNGAYAHRKIHSNDKHDPTPLIVQHEK